MILYFANRTMSILGLASTELGEGFHVSDDTKTEDIDTGVAVFECEIHWTEESRGLAKECASVGNYLLRSNNGDGEFYTIIECEEDTKDRTIYIYAEDAGMDLLNGMAGPLEGESGMTAAGYVQIWIEDSGWEIGINEISSLTRKLEWTGEATIAERIASIATQFDNAEVGYSFDIEGLTVKHKYVNLYKQRGQDAGVTLRLNREVDRIVTTTSVADLATALYVTGGIPEGEEEAITLLNYEDAEDDGDIYTSRFSYLVRSNSALSEWARVSTWGGDSSIESVNDIVKFWSYDTTSQSELYHRAVTQLKKVYTPAVNYEIEITNMPDVGIGDTVYIIDENGNLYLQSRVLQMQTSVCNETQKLTLGDYLINSGGLSSTVKSLSAQVSSIEQKTISTAAKVATGEAEKLVDQWGNTYVYSPYEGQICIEVAGSDGDLMLQKDGLYIGTQFSGSIYIGNSGWRTEEVNIYGKKVMFGAPLTGAGECESVAIGCNTVSDVSIAGREISLKSNNDGTQNGVINIGSGATDVYVNGQPIYTSDASLKTLIQPLKASELNNLTPVSFKWKDGDDRTHYGYVAQDVQEYMPELVKEHDGLLSMAYMEIIPLLHCKINELEERIKKLEVQNGSNIDEQA